MGVQDVLTRYLVGAVLSVLSAATAAEARRCPPGFPDEPAISRHIEQSHINAGRYDLGDLFSIGEAFFEAIWNRCDGQGRPAATGTGAARSPFGQPALSRTSGPDSNSCAGCHNAPRVGGGGDVVANVFVLAQALDPVTESIAPRFSNERNTLGMFGSGAIEMLAREMTTELQAQAAALPDGSHVLRSKGVEFTIDIAGGKVISSRGIDTDLVVKPFHQAGVVTSLREFTNNAFNHHHGMQSEERFDLNPATGYQSDHDQDGVHRELTIGDITAVTLYQAALPVPGQVLPDDTNERRKVHRGEHIFSRLGCVDCHVPRMTLESRYFVEPNPLNPPGNWSDTSQSFRFDLSSEGQRPRVHRGPNGTAVVEAYSDLKRHNLCDDEIRHYCNEQLAQGRPEQDGAPGSEFFLTRKLWDVGNSAPYGHRGDLSTITEAIHAHGGEARAARDAFVEAPYWQQVAVVKFLKSLQVLPAGSPRVISEAELRQRRASR